TPIRIGIGHHDHLVGELGTLDEALGIEGRIGIAYRAQAFVEVRTGLRDGVYGLVVRIGLAAAFAPRPRNDVLGLAVRVLARACGGIGVERRAFISGA